MTKPTPRSIVLTDRDFALFRGLFEARVMKLTHIAKLYFEGKEEAAKKRIQKLKASGFVRERKGRRAYESAILSLTRPAFEAVTERGMLAGYPSIAWKALEKRLDVSDLTLRHELAVLDVKAALGPAIEQQGNCSVTEFIVWPHLCEFTVVRRVERKVVKVKPDGLLRIGETVGDGDVDEHVFFFEIDRGSETHDILVNKAVDYRAYSKSGDLAKRLGEDGAVPFRVLMVFRTPARKQTPSIERRNNAAERLLLSSEPFGNFIWMTTLEEILENPLGAIWVTPAAYRQASQGTQYDPERRRDYTGPYVRRPDRERFIETHVVKKRLLEG